MKQRYIRCIALLYSCIVTHTWWQSLISGYSDTARYSDTAIQRDTAIQMYHHPSGETHVQHRHAQARRMQCAVGIWENENARACVARRNRRVPLSSDETADGIRKVGIRPRSS